MLLENALVGGLGPRTHDLDRVVACIFLDLTREILGLREEGLLLRPLENEPVTLDHSLHANADISYVLNIQGLQGGDLACVGFMVEINMS